MWIPNVSQGRKVGARLRQSCRGYERRPVSSGQQARQQEPGAPAVESCGHAGKADEARSGIFLIPDNMVDKQGLDKEILWVSMLFDLGDMVFNPFNPWSNVLGSTPSDRRC